MTSATGSFTYEGKPNAKVEVQLLVKNQSQDKVITLDRAMLVEKLKKKDISVVNGEQTIHIKAGTTTKTN